MAGGIPMVLLPRMRAGRAGLVVSLLHLLEMPPWREGQTLRNRSAVPAPGKAPARAAGRQGNPASRQPETGAAAAWAGITPASGVSSLGEGAEQN